METKHCRTCDSIKPTAEFSSQNRRGKQGYQSKCKLCSSLDCKKRYDSGDRKLSVTLRRNTHRKFLKDYVRDYKLEKGCSSCGYKKNPFVLELHHINDKDNDVCTLASKGVSFDRLKSEIEKCIVLCSNCHRELHNPYDKEKIL